MKALIISDTHGYDRNMMEVIEAEKPFDLLIHLGDVEGSETLIPELVGEDCVTAIVRGNNDFFSDLERELVLKIGPHKILATHGHYYNVSFGVEDLYDRAVEEGCDLAMYGHTHRPFFEKMGEVTILNPGSLSFPRQSGRKPSYMIMEMDETGKLEFSQEFLDGAF